MYYNTDYLARSPGVKREASAMEGLGSQNLSAMAFALQLFSHGSLAVASQLLTSSGKCLEFVSRFLYSICVINYCGVLRRRDDR